MHLPENVKMIINRLEAAGFEAYAVGGCVRDWLMGKTPPDYDIATSAIPDETKQVFADMRTVDIGAKHGTIAVIIEHEKIEITTFRSDGEYSDSRHPDSVVFTKNLENDLSRRDFTINAMAYSETRGLVNIFGGEEDLKNKILRCVGEPEQRFNEDALRIMRALRFMSELNLSLEEKTEKDLRKLKNNLHKIAPERIRAELDRLILGGFAEEVILKYFDVLGVFIPEILDCKDFDQRSKYHIYDVLTHTAKTISAAPKKRVIRLAMLFHDLAKPACFTLKNGAGSFKGHAEKSAKITERIMKNLRYDNTALRRVTLLVASHNETFKTDNISIKKLLNKYGLETLLQLCEVMIADDSAKAQFVKDEIKDHKLIMQKAQEIVQKGECYSLPQLEIGGDDLITLGLKGEEIGKTLNKLLCLVIEEKIKNNRKVLLDTCHQWISA